MDQTPTVDLDKLEQYLNAERAKAERATHAEKRAQLDRFLEEREKRIAAALKADRERRDADDPNLQAAKMIYAALGDQWSALVALTPRMTAVKMVSALSRLERERKAGFDHEVAGAATQIRPAAGAAREGGIATEIEKQLVAAGLISGLTEDTDIQ